MISVIGAGPAGAYTSYLLAKQGYDVKLFEEHTTIGSPIQCTGILTEGIFKFFKPKKETIANTISRIKIHSQNEEVELKLKKKEIIVNRTEFDRSIADMAHDAGTEVLTGHRFLEKQGKNIIIQNVKNLEKKQFSPSYLIGADGPNSQVAKSSNIHGGRRFWIARQCRAKINSEKDLFKVHFDKNISPDFFGWVVPENEKIARIGIGAEKNSEEYFKRYLLKLGNPEIIDYQAGLIPIYDPKLPRQKNNIYLIGDAALQTKALSGGGIIKGMMAAEELNKAIINNLDYEKLWRKRMGKDLLLSLKIRNFLNELNNEDYDKLTSSFNENALSLFNREFPKKSLLNVLLRSPKLDFFMLSKLIKIF